MKEIKEKYWKGLLLVLETYTKIRNVLKGFIPRLSESGVDVKLEKLMVISCG